MDLDQKDGQDKKEGQKNQITNNSKKQQDKDNT